MILTFDSESDGLLDTATKMHVAVFKNFETGKYTEFSNGEYMAKILLKTAKLGDLTLVGHNIIGYDLPLFEKLFGLGYDVQPDLLYINNEQPVNVNYIDTMVMSRELWPDRPWGHGLEEWGKKLGQHKPEIDDWQNVKYEDALYRCKEDVGITEKLFVKLMKEARIDI